MLKVSRLADYAVLLLADLARPGAAKQTARDLAARTGLPRPTVTKLLKALSRGGLLASTRGASGGYALERRPAEISVAEVLAAVDGPPALTQCTEPGGEACERELTCPTRAQWRRVHGAVTAALTELTVADLLEPVASAPTPARARVVLRGLSNREHR